MRFTSYAIVVGSILCTLISQSFSMSSPLYTEEIIKNSTFRLYTVTYATNISHREFCLSMTSAAMNGHYVNVIGYDRKTQFNQYMLLDKLWALEGFLGHIPESEDVTNVVLFLDAYDTITLKSPRAILRHFLQSYAGILFAAERGCSSTKAHMLARRKHCDHNWPFPRQPTPTPFLNSGAFIGFRNTLSTFLSYCREEYTDTVNTLRSDQVDPYVSGTDQQLIAQLFSYGIQISKPSQLQRQLNMQIDILSELFFCTYNVNVQDSLDFRHVRKPNRLTVTVTQMARDCIHLDEPLRTTCNYNPLTYLVSRPAILHFNGVGDLKKLPFEYVVKHVYSHQVPLDAFEQKMWVSGTVNTNLWDQCSVYFL